jgi:hypothetical protein
MRAVGIRSRTAKLVAVTVLCLGAGSAAYAATSGSQFVGTGESITSCLPPHGGTVHVWLPGHRCSGGWVQLNWGAVGATGAAGATGPAGPVNPSATTVDGQTVSKLLLKVPTPGSGTTTSTLYSADGLTILAECDSSGNASLVANGPSSNDSELTVSGEDTAGSFGSQTANLGSSSNAPLGPASSGQASFSYASSAGNVLTGSVGYQKASSFGSYAGCAFFGDITSG